MACHGKKARLCCIGELQLSRTLCDFPFEFDLLAAQTFLRFLRTSTSALSNKLGTVILIKNINTSRNETLRSAVVKGPPHVSVPQIVMPASTKETVAVSRGPRRSAAHN